MLQAFIAPVLSLGHWEAQEKVHWCIWPNLVLRQTKPKPPRLLPPSSEFGWLYSVYREEGDNLAQLSVMASKTQPQILPKESDSFFSSLWNWFKWSFKTDLVSLALLKGSHANCDLSVHLSCFFPLLFFSLPFLPPPFIIFFLSPGLSKKHPPPPCYLQENTFLFSDTWNYNKCLWNETLLGEGGSGCDLTFQGSPDKTGVNTCILWIIKTDIRKQSPPPPPLPAEHTCNLLHCVQDSMCLQMPRCLWSGMKRSVCLGLLPSLLVLCVSLWIR